MSLLITIGLLIAAYQYLWPLLSEEVPVRAREWVAIGLAFVCILPQVAYEVLFPHPFDLTAYKNAVDYEFADQELAHDFAELNEDAEWVRVDGDEWASE